MAANVDIIDVAKDDDVDDSEVPSAVINSENKPKKKKNKKKNKAGVLSVVESNGHDENQLETSEANQAAADHVDEHEKEENEAVEGECNN